MSSHLQKDMDGSLPPKAEARGSNPLGCAKINDLAHLDFSAHRSRKHHGSRTGLVFG
jgi:hypothetical protein